MIVGFDITSQKRLIIKLQYYNEWGGAWGDVHPCTHDCILS